MSTLLAMALAGAINVETPKNVGNEEIVLARRYGGGFSSSRSWSSSRSSSSRRSTSTTRKRDRYDNDDGFGAGTGFLFGLGAGALLNSDEAVADSADCEDPQIICED